MNLLPEIFCLLVIGLTIILKSWKDCGSDHDEENKLTYPGKNEVEVK